MISQTFYPVKEREIHIRMYIEQADDNVKTIVENLSKTLTVAEHEIDILEKATSPNIMPLINEYFELRGVLVRQEEENRILRDKLESVELVAQQNLKTISNRHDEIANLYDGLCIYLRQRFNLDEDENIEEGIKEWFENKRLGSLENSL